MRRRRLRRHRCSADAPTWCLSEGKLPRCWRPRAAPVHCPWCHVSHRVRQRSSARRLFSCLPWCVPRPQAPLGPRPLSTVRHHLPPPAEGATHHATPTHPTPPPTAARVAHAWVQSSFDVKANLDRAEAAVRECVAATGANLVLLPELFAGPYWCAAGQHPGYCALAEEVEESAVVARFRRLAAEVRVVGANTGPRCGGLASSNTTGLCPSRADAPRAASPPPLLLRPPSAAPPTPRALPSPAESGAARVVLRA